MAAVQRKLVHKQFNSPIGLYSQQNVKETLDREIKAFGGNGIEIDEQITKPLNLANSAVLRAVEEEEEMKCGYKRVAWPPASEERIVREFTPQPPTQYQPVPAYNQQQHPPTATAPATQGPIYNNVQHQTPPNNTNKFAHDTNPSYNQNSNQDQYEPFPPQTPETPIVLKDKQFSRPPSFEPSQTSSVPYQQHQSPYQQQQERPPYQHQYPQQSQNPPVYKQPQHQQQYKQEPQYQPPSFSEPVYQQQSQQQQPPFQQYQPDQQNVPYPQQQQQQYQQQYQERPLSGWKSIRPPQSKQETVFTRPLNVQDSSPSGATPIYQQQFQNYHQQPQQPQHHQQQQYRASSYDNYQQPHCQQQPQQQQYSPQLQHQNQVPPSQNQYQQSPQPGPHYQQPNQQYQQPSWAQQSQPQHQQYQQPNWSQTTQQQQPQEYQQPPWVQQPQHNQQPQQQQYQQQQPQYQTPLNQYNNQAPHQQQQNHFLPQTNQQPFNSYSQSQQQQQQQHTLSHDQVDQQQHQQQRGTSPGIITLRKEAPVTQKPAPVFTSQPAAISFRESSTDSLGGSNMRGDLKWPPPEYKEAAAKENEERRKLALGPVCRPRKVHRDYTSFFAKNALSHHYPSYKVPPGTQHMTC